MISRATVRPPMPESKTPIGISGFNSLYCLIIICISLYYTLFFGFGFAKLPEDELVLTVDMVLCRSGCLFRVSVQNGAADRAVLHDQFFIVQIIPYIFIAEAVYSVLISTFLSSSEILWLASLAHS